MANILVFQLCNASQAAATFNRNQPSQQELAAQCKLVLELIPHLVQGMTAASNNPESVQAVRHLIDMSNALLQVNLWFNIISSQQKE